MGEFTKFCVFKAQRIYHCGPPASISQTEGRWADVLLLLFNNEARISHKAMFNIFNNLADRLVKYLANKYITHNPNIELV